MRFKRLNATSGFRISGIFTWILFCWCVPGNGNGVHNLHGSFTGFAIPGILTVGISAYQISHIQGSALTHTQEETKSSSIFNLAKNTNNPNNVPYSSQNLSHVVLPTAETTTLNVTSDNLSKINPRRLTKLPKSVRSSRYRKLRESKSSQAESHLKRARLLLGSLSRQNCFAKVLCGLGARPPTTKTDLLNDYVYLMEELMVDDDDDQAVGKLKKSKQKSNKNRNKGKTKQKLHTKNDESDSSQSKSDEVTDDEKNGEFGFLADSELASEDPQILKYVQLEQNRRKYKNDLPKSSLPTSILMQRKGRFGNLDNSTFQVVEGNLTGIDTSKVLVQKPLTRQQRLLKTKKGRKLIRQMARAVNTGRTFGNTRQCRAVFDRCPFDDNQMNEIIGNLKKMMTPQVQTPAQSQTTSVTTGTGNTRTTTVGQSAPGPGGSKVEIVLHLNQNGMPYQNGYGQGPYNVPYGQMGAPQMQPPGLQPQIPVGMQPQIPVGMQPQIPVGMQPQIPVGMQPQIPLGVHPQISPGVQPQVTAGVQPQVPHGIQPQLHPVAQPGIQPAKPTTDLGAFQSPPVPSLPPGTLQTQPETHLPQRESQPSDLQPIPEALPMQPLIPSTSQLNPTFPSVLATQQTYPTMAQPYPTSPQMYPPMLQTYPTLAQPPYIPETTIQTTTPPPPPPETTTTLKPNGEEQLLDFLYGVVNFNDSDNPTPVFLDEQPNPFWTLANSHNPDAENIEDPFGDVVKPLKQKKRKPPSWNADDDDDIDDSKSSEEIELRKYLLSLRETLQGFAHMNNATLQVEQKVVKSSEEDSSQEDPLDDDLPLPGVLDGLGKDSSEEEDNTSDKEVDLTIKKKKKSKKKNKKPSGAVEPSNSKPIRAPKPQQPDSEPLFDDDNEDNGDRTQLKTKKQENSKKRPNKQKSKKKNPPKEAQEDDEFEPEESSQEDDQNDDEQNDNNESHDEEQQDSEEDHQNDDNNDEDQSGNESNEDNDKPEVNDDDEQEDIVAKPKSKPKKKKRPAKITLKFNPNQDTYDPYEMSSKEKMKLAALSDALLPTEKPQRPVSPNKKIPHDIVEEIKIPSIKPLQNEFQMVSNIVKSTEVINIDEFAEDSGKNPIFPKKKGPPHRMNYLNKRRPAPTRPIEKKENVDSTSGSSEEEEDISGPSARGESIEIDSPDKKSKPKAKKKSKSKKSTKGSIQPQIEDVSAEVPDIRPLIAIPPPTPIPTIISQIIKGSPSKRPSGALIAVPYLQQPYSSQPRPQQAEGTFDFLGSVMDMMGMKPAGDNPAVGAQLPGQTYYPIGYNGPSQQPFQRHFQPHLLEEPTKKGSGKKRKGPQRAKSDLFESVQKDGNPKPKISINILPEIPNKPVKVSPDYSDELQDDLKDKKGDKKEEDKKGGEDDKKDKDKKVKSKKTKKKKKDKDDDGGVHGFSTQFHQQIFPATEAPGLWDKLKGYIDKLSSKEGETPFIHVGLDSGQGQHHDSLLEVNGPSHNHNQNHGPPGQSHNHGPPAHGHGAPGPSHHHQGPPFNSFEHSSEEEEDEEDEEEDDIGDSDEPELENNENSEASTTTILPSTSSHSILSSPEQSTTPFPTTLEPIPETTSKVTLAPKPPKYKVTRVRKRNKKKKNGTPRSTVGPPVMLFSTTTEAPPPTTIFPTPPPRSKPPKRRIFYKPPSQRVNKVPGEPLQIPTTVRPTTFQPPHSKNQRQKYSGEDDEVEPPSVFFQPGPKGQNIRGKPPVPIDAFHIQSEDMLVDPNDERQRTNLRIQGSSISVEDFGGIFDSEETRGSGSHSMERPNRQNIPPRGPPPPRRARPYPNSQSSEDSSGEDFSRLEPLRHSPQNQRRPGINQSHGNNRHPTHSQNYNREEQSAITSAVMNSPIFSDHFKHLYTKFSSFGQSFIPNGNSNRPSG